MKLIAIHARSQYYIGVENEDSWAIHRHDNAIVEALEMTRIDYLEELNKFGARAGFFVRKRDVDKAIEYIESLMVMRKLAHETYDS